jgi:hypothetical protein
MLSIVLKLVSGLYRSALRRSMRRMMLIVALTLLALLAWMVAAGFGLLLAYVWLQPVEGTAPALAIMSGGCIALGLILLLVALFGWRHRRWRGASELLGATSKTERIHIEPALKDGVAALQGSTQESILAAAALALVTGIMLGRRL